LAAKTKEEKTSVESPRETGGIQMKEDITAFSNRKEKGDWDFKGTIKKEKGSGTITVISRASCEGRCS